MPCNQVRFRPPSTGVLTNRPMTIAILLRSLTRRGLRYTGASLAAVAGDLLIAAGWGVGAFIAALAMFRWQ